jgi:protein-tyrosine phosphatase
MYKHFAKVNDNIYFGKYPDEEVLLDLKNIEVDVIVDLTHYTDKMLPYITDITVIKFPIVDMNICNDNKIWPLMNNLFEFLKNHKKIYIHCKGGHGRSAVIAACLFGLFYKKSASKSLVKISAAHSRRLIMKDKWRKIGAPQTSEQVTQVYRIIDGEKSES